ncbi:MAG: SDR family NAD(P)-dependent oxidoreductase [Pseudomonadota bacterium]|nr:SDR family NAD(P)-dependent oxidoreductase [Pseudomonadota bacterium]
MIKNLDDNGIKLNMAVIGASGGIGNAVMLEAHKHPAIDKCYGLSRGGPHKFTGEGKALFIDIESEESIAQAVQQIRLDIAELEIILVATGLLHNASATLPEKSINGISAANMLINFQINTVGPALIAKHFRKLLPKKRKAVIAFLSARVGSIEDNKSGGWYSYRSSKAALNMVIKTFSIELSRSNPEAICVGLHPGTVDTSLSKPFHKYVQKEKLFTPDFAAKRLFEIIANLTQESSGSIIAWDGNKIPF